MAVDTSSSTTTGPQGMQAPGPGIRSQRSRSVTARVLRVALVVGLIALVIYPLLWVFLRGLIDDTGRINLGELNDALHVYEDPRFVDAVSNTIVIGLSVSVLAGVLGVFLAWAVARTDIWLRSVVERLIIVPFITTPLIGAFAWVVLATPRTGMLNQLVFHHLGFTFNVYSRVGITLVMGLYLCPYVFLLTTSALKRIDPTLEHASMVAGRSRAGSFLRITLPLALPALLASMMLTLIDVFEQFGVPAILGLPHGIYMLTTLIYQYMRQFPAAYAATSGVAVLLLAMTALFVLTQRRVLGSRRSYVTIGGREFRPARMELGRWRAPVTGLCLLYVLLAVVLPFGGLLVVSLTRVWNARIDPSAWSLHNYTELISQVSVRLAMWNSFRLSVAGTAVSVALTLTAAYLIKRGHFRGRGAIVFLTTLPITVPGIVLAVGLFQAYSRPPLVLYGTIWILFVAYVTRHLPYGMRAAEAALEQLSAELEDSARVCGASWLRTFRTVVLPLLAPSVVAGATLMFVAMMRELSASVLLYTSNTMVNAVLMVSMWEGGDIEQLAAFAILVTFGTFIVIGIVQRLTRVDLARRA